MPEEEEQVEIGSPKHVSQETDKIKNDITSLKAKLEAANTENGALEVSCYSAVGYHCHTLLTWPPRCCQTEITGLNATIEVKNQVIPELESALRDLQQESTCTPPKDWPLTLSPAHGIAAGLLRDCLYAIKVRSLRGSLRVWRAMYRADLVGTGSVEAARVRALIKREEAEKKELKRKIETLKTAIAEKAAEEAAKEAGRNTNKAALALSVLDLRIKMQISPLTYNKAGQVISKLIEAGYSEPDCNSVCRALFLDQREEDMKDAWMLFSNGAPHVESDKFRNVLPLMGDEVPELQMDELFAMVDDDGSGTLDFSEFIMLVRSMNPKGEHTQAADPDKKEEGFGGVHWYKKEEGLFGKIGGFF